MDPLTKFLREITDELAELPDSTASFILRAALFFGVTTALAGWAFRAGSRCQFTQVMAFTVGFLVATFLNAEFLILNHPALKSAVVLISLVAVLFLPMRLAFFLTPHAHTQKWVRRGSYGFILFMFLLSL